MSYKALNRTATLEHLAERQIINIDEYIEKLRFFKKYTDSRDDFNFGVKTMEESSGPCEDYCPASILSLLSPTDSEYANSWRDRCRKNIEAKKDPHALKNLPVGAVIRFTLHTGESIELLKHAAAYQFKRPFWFCQSSGCYMPVTRIPANYEVVTA